MSKCVYPGSFDPITLGHVDVIERTAKIFDDVTVAVLNNYNKSSVFTLKERKVMIEKSIAHLKNVHVDSFDGLLVDYMQKNSARIIIRGLRAISDFEHEFQMAAMNNRLDSDMETIFMMTSTEHSFLSSSMVRELCSVGGNIDSLVPKEIILDIKQKLLK